MNTRSYLFILVGYHQLLSCRSLCGLDLSTRCTGPLAAVSYINRRIELQYEINKLLVDIKKSQLTHNTAWGMLMLRGSSMHDPDTGDIDISTGQSEDKHVIVANNSSSGVTNTGTVAYIVNYSSRSLAVFGDTKTIKEELKELGGRFNKYLKHDGLTKAGWIFPLKARADVEELIGESGDGADRYRDYSSVISVNRGAVANKSSRTIIDNDEAHARVPGAIYIVNYSDRSIAVFGDTKPIKEELKELGGRFNKYLKHFGETKAGWIFPLKARADVEELIGKSSDGADRYRDYSSVISANRGTAANESSRTIIDNDDAHARVPGAIYIVDYSDRSIAVFGDTKPIKEELKELGGRFNMYLKHDGETKAGWIFPLKARADVEKLSG